MQSRPAMHRQQQQGCIGSSTAAPLPLRLLLLSRRLPRQLLRLPSLLLLLFADAR
jgi:hypothetical protein